MIDELLAELESKMEKAIESFVRDLSRIRTGRASLGVLDSVKVEYYGQQTPLNQVASLSIPESRLIVIKPWDKSMLSKIERAILEADLGLTPTNDGNVIRIAFPPLSEERRRELFKLVKKIAEEFRIEIRRFRREGNEELKEYEKEGMISEDDYHRALDKVQELTDKYIKKIDEILAKKEKEIMEI
ncbi:MAG TPA: ribosome recycling factor [Proteobacteria bacterium]|nr:ribosome recycling factor [Pseudomonadota bacterium]